MEHKADVFMAEIPKAWGISWDAFADPLIARSRAPRGANANAAFADPKGQTVTPCVIVVMAGPAGNILVS